ncbi:MAG: DUF4374 domain-containing protein [Flavobacteriales bacterium]
MKTTQQIYLLALATATVLGSCKKPEPGVENIEPTYAFGLRSLGEGDETADYLVVHNDLMSGEITSTGKGVELSGWNYYARGSKRLLTMDYNQNECSGYDFENGNFVNKGKFVFERLDCMNPGADDETVVAIGAPWGGGSYDCNIQLLDVQDVSIKSSKKHPIYVSFHNDTTQLNAWPTHSYVENGKLFVSFYPLEGKSWETPITDTAYVSVFSYPDMTYLKTFKDTRTGPIGYYGSQPAILEDESGNHYTISTSSYAAGFTQVTKSSGILKINAGQEQFDANYFFDVEGVSGFKLLTAAYVGNGKAVGRVVASETSADQWAAFDVTKPTCKLVVLDLNAKTVIEVTSVPLHGGQYQTPFYIENGKVYMSINNGTETYVYEINPSDASAKKGAKIVGQELQSIFKL